MIELLVDKSLYLIRLVNEMSFSENIPKFEVLSFPNFDPDLVKFPPTRLCIFAVF